MRGYRFKKSVSMRITIDMKAMLRFLSRKYIKAIRYTQDCIFILDMQEMTSASKILDVLYKHHVEFKDGGVIPGLSQEEIIKESGLTSATIGAITAKLCPPLIYINSPKGYIANSGKKRPRYHVLNEYGVMFVEGEKKDGV